jgi:hypothetical protein
MDIIKHVQRDLAQLLIDSSRRKHTELRESIAT